MSEFLSPGENLAGILADMIDLNHRIDGLKAEAQYLLQRMTIMEIEAAALHAAYDARPK